MKTTILTLIILAFNIVSALSADSTYIDTLLARHPLKANEAMVLVFIEYGSCVKCIMYPEAIIEQLKKETNHEIKMVAMIGCDRAKEIGGFKETYGWKYDVEPDLKRRGKEKTGCERDSEICMISSDGRMIAQISSHNDYKENLQKLKDALKTLKP